MIGYGKNKNNTQQISILALKSFIQSHVLVRVIGLRGTNVCPDVSEYLETDGCQYPGIFPRNHHIHVTM